MHFAARDLNSLVLSMFTVKAYTHWIQYGNVGQFSGFQKSTNLVMGKFYLKFYNISTARLIYFSYLLKFFIVDRFICFSKN